MIVWPKRRAAAAAPKTPEPFPRSVVLTGLIVTLVFGGGLATWAAVAPVDGATIAPAVVTVASRRQAVQHLEGGVVDAIHVRNGDTVRAGQRLVTLRSVAGLAELDQLRGERRELLAAIARLQAEQSGADAIAFPEELAPENAPASGSSPVADQQRIFDSRRRVVEEQGRVFMERAAEPRRAIQTSRRDVLALVRQRAATTVELARVRRDLSNETGRALDLERSLEDLGLRLGALRAEMANAQGALERVRSEERAAAAERQAALAEELRADRARLWEVEKRISAVSDVVERTEIVAPGDGSVVNLSITTAGAVVQPGQLVMEIVPSGDALVIDAFIAPHDVDTIRPGGSVQIALMTQSRRSRQLVEGVVQYVSADRLTQPQTGRSYYSARINFKNGTLSDYEGQIIPGMGAEVYIRTGERSLTDYLLDPITRSLRAGMREE